jgi:hypothetical protein
VLAGAVFALVTLLRWFEQATEAVENRWWNKVFVLVVAPPAVWLYPSRVAAGRPSAVPRHEPVRGFGKVSLNAPTDLRATDATRAPDAAEGKPQASASAALRPDDRPPPGTPKEFIGLPKIPPKKPPGAKSAVDPEKIAKLKQKMREQGMLGDDQ